MVCSVLLGAAVMEQQSLVMGDEFDFGQVQQQSRTVEPSMSFLNTEALISKGLLVAKTWQQVVVGDIIVCRNRDRFPAGKFYCKNYVFYNFLYTKHR